MEFNRRAKERWTLAWGVLRISHKLNGVTLDMKRKSLASRECVPCRGGIPPLANEQVSALLKQLEPGWEVVDGHHLKREYPFKDFKQALAFVNRVGELAEQQQHHPDLYLTWGRVVVTLWTHKIDALTENDFRLAAKIDALLI